MYSTCLFCNGDLGANEAIEAFPVGRRLAFDAARGRLWVVCRKCERWNLTPLEERWEAIEQCERAFSGTRLRVSTDQVGLAKLGEGLELVRIGQPQRPELAAWRYGDQFGRRRRRAFVRAGAGLLGVGALAVGGTALGLSIGAFAITLINMARGATGTDPDKEVARVANDARTQLWVVTRGHLELCRVVHEDDGSLALWLQHAKGRERLTGALARSTAQRLLTAASAYGGSRRAVQAAVATLESSGSAEGFFRDLVKRERRRERAERWGGDHDGPLAALAWWGGDQAFGMEATERLALEMALHEEQERRALEGELAELERAWRDAEEIAAIADGMFVGDEVTRKLDRLRGGEPAA